MLWVFIGGAFAGLIVGAWLGWEFHKAHVAYMLDTKGWVLEHKIPDEPVPQPEFKEEEE